MRMLSFLSLIALLGVAVADELPPEIPGTGVATPKYDPNHGGWDSERLAEEASLQLNVLKDALETGSAGASLAAMVSEGFAGEALRPLTVSVFEDAVVDVRRASGGKSVRFQGKDGWVKAVQTLTDPLQAGPLHAKFKTIGVDVENDGAQLRFEIRLDGQSKDGKRLQVNAQWATRWQREGEQLEMTRFEITDYEEILTKRPHPQPLFADATGASLGQDPAFQQQLAYGIDHWLARLDTRTGIKVGGWNGLAIGDANGDGIEDLYVCQNGGLPNRLFLGRADGTAGDVAAAAGVDWLETSRGALWIDLDNDGDQDLIVAVSEGLLVHENDGGGRFQVRSAEVLPFAVPYSLAAADYDQDGDLDIFAACYDRRGHVDRNISLARPVPYHDANNGGRNALLRNEGGFRFSHQTKRVGLDEHNTRYSYAAAWADYDRDGDLDLYVANDFGRNNLYRQERQGDRIRFVDVAEEMGVLDIAAGMSAAWGDYDNDGLLDLYVSNMFSSAGNRIVTQGQFLANEDKATRALFLRHARGNSLFRNTGSGFDDVSIDAAVTQGRWAWGSAFADLNNDGWQDLVVANGFITQADTGDL